MTRRQTAALMGGLLWLVVSVGVLAAQRPSNREPPGAAAGGQASARAQRADAWFVQDLYARLLRYDFAARRLSAAETGLVPEPDAYLALRVRDIRSDGDAAGDQSPAEASPGPRIRLERQTQCQQGDPCHASYAVGWDTGDGGADSQAVTDTVAGPVVRVTTYQVTLTLAGETREYTAQVRYHAAPEGGALVPEVVDPVIPGLQRLVDDRAPLATPRWDSYVGTRRYAAVVQRLKGLTGAGKRAAPGRRPIGFLPGDDVTPQDVAMAMMAPEEGCGEAPSLMIWGDQQSLRPEGAGTPDWTTIRVMTTPHTPGVDVTLTLEAEADSGGHVDLYHTGARPAGRLNDTSGTTDSGGGFNVTYFAPQIAGRVTVRAWMGETQATFRMDIGVPGLEELFELGPGSFELIGQTPSHPQGTNHWGTPEANQHLRDIAQAYLTAFPGADPLLYNDQSLPWGGRFDAELRNWESGGHNEHRLGTDCDVDSTAVPMSRWTRLNVIFFEKGASSVLDETADNHWHVRF